MGADEEDDGEEADEADEADDVEDIDDLDDADMLEELLMAPALGGEQPTGAWPRIGSTARRIDDLDHSFVHCQSATSI